MIRGVAVGVALVALGGCAKDGRSTAPRGTHRYATGAPGKGWRAQDPGGADHAWFHPGLSASIYADANCAERFEDGPLDDLLTHLSFGVAQGEPERDEALRLDDRAAHLKVGSGALDGVAVKVGAAVTKKDGCVYDFVIIGPPATFEEAWGGMVRVLEGFHTGAGG
jgi:hypothetical protein